MRATDPRWRPVVVNLGPPPEAGEDPPRTSKFSFAWDLDIITPGSSYDRQRHGTWGRRVFGLGPRSSVRAVFQLPINSTAGPVWERVEDIPPANT